MVVLELLWKMSGNGKSLKEDFSPRCKFYKALCGNSGPEDACCTGIGHGQPLSSHRGISMENAQYAVGSSNLSVLFLHCILCCASVPDNI